MGPEYVASEIAKTDFTTAAGWDPEDTRIARVIFDAQRPAPRVVDLIPALPTNQSTVLFMEETTFTNTAAETAENAGHSGPSVGIFS